MHIIVRILTYGQKHDIKWNRLEEQVDFLLSFELCAIDSEIFPFTRRKKKDALGNDKSKRKIERVNPFVPFPSGCSRIKGNDLCYKIKVMQ